MMMKYIYTKSRPVEEVEDGLTRFRGAIDYADSWVGTLYPTWEAARLSLIKSRVSALTDASLLAAGRGELGGR